MGPAHRQREILWVYNDRSEQGFNIGKPCYGYIAEKIKHPVPAKRADGRHRHRLIPNPTRQQTVPKIFDLRVAVREILLNPKYTGYMAWNRRATKDKRHPGKYNPKEQWVISSVRTHPALVSVEKFLAAQAVKGARVGRQPHRADQDVMAANSHPQTKHVYKLRSYIWCAPCQRRMYGHMSRSGTAYCYCQPRGRELPEGHPAAARMREDELMVAVTRFFNRHVLGPDRMALLGNAMPAANDFVRGEHEKTEAALRRKLAELDSSMDNLMRVLERERDPEGQLYRRTKKRMGELESELHEVEAQLRRHVAAKPPELDDNVSLLEHLPQAEVDLGRLAADRLRRFLNAFRVEIHYDCRTRRGTFRAEIGGTLSINLRTW